MSASIVDLHALQIELDNLKLKYKKLLNEISGLEKERASTLKRIRILNYKIEDGDQVSLPELNLNDIKGKK